MKFKVVSSNTFKFLLFTVVILVFLVLPASAYSNIPSGDFDTNSSWTQSITGLGAEGFITFYTSGSYDDSAYAYLYAKGDYPDGDLDRNYYTYTTLTQTVDVTGKDTLYFYARYHEHDDTYSYASGRVYVGTRSTYMLNDNTWHLYSIDVSDLEGEQEIKIEAYAKGDYGWSDYATAYLMVDHFYFDSDYQEPIYSLSCSPYPLYKTDSTVVINLSTEYAYGETVNVTAYGHTGSVYGEIESTSLGIASDSLITNTVFSFPLVDTWDYITVEAEVDGQIVDSRNVTVYNNYVAYNPDGSYNFNVGDEYNPDDLGLIKYYAREIYEDGTIVYQELDSQSGTITPTYPDGEHGDLISVTIVESFAGIENQIIDTLNSTEEFDYIDVDENNTQVWYDFGDLWGISGYTYFVKLHYFPPYEDQIIQVYSQSGYVNIDYPDYFGDAETYFKFNGDSYLVDQSTREDSSAPEVPPDEDDDDDDLIDNLDTPEAPDGPDSDSNSDSPFPDPLENESENNDTWPEAPNAPEIIDVPTSNETNVTIVGSNTTSGYYASVNDSIGSLFAPAHAFANYVASPFADVAGSLYIVSTSMGSQDLSDSQAVADDLGSGVKSSYPSYFVKFGDVVICLAIISMILRGSNE
ncbi:hypothetical protein MSSAC_0951 [Methanosarcina siciliae C2J]|uniref:Uncharacterized protein n=1 Tax=Methanosarcina siciliae C2J TaxID=1434118 RepID=A0A0E3LCH7_9EURY|nr:hypothetical protein [Methanosarcina siciliae]AKB35541.1 hypothetical protein MSSAC_0951 [Methanosarcina siciliae C2J]